MKKSTLLLVIASLLLLVVTGLTIAFEGQITWLHIPLMMFGSITVLLLPGYWITRWTFPLTGHENLIDPTEEKPIKKSEEDESIHTIDGIERFVLSIALSISAVPLVVFYVNFLGVPVTIWSVFYTICGITLSSLGGAIFIEYRHAKHK